MVTNFPILIEKYGWKIGKADNVLEGIKYNEKGFIINMFVK